MPTVIELAGLPPSREKLGGSSFALLVVQAAGYGGAAEGSSSDQEPGYAFTTFPRCNCSYATNVIGTRNGTCPLDIAYRGYPAVRSALVPGVLSASNMHVCLETTALAFDWIGLSVRDPEWRFTLVRSSLVRVCFNLASQSHVYVRYLCRDRAVVGVEWNCARSVVEQGGRR
jgi:hypothetical protein